MKAISLWQPWASAIALGIKKNETRKWRTNYLGEIAIHAALKETAELRAIFDGLLHDHPEIEAAFKFAKQDDFHSLPFGSVVAVATIQSSGDIFFYSGCSKVERALGDYSEGRFGWSLKEVKLLKQPVPCAGRQQMFYLTPQVEVKVREQL